MAKMHCSSMKIRNPPCLLGQVGGNRSLTQRLGQQAMEQLYLSWEDSVKQAYQQYYTVLDHYNRGLSSRSMSGQMRSIICWMISERELLLPETLQKITVAAGRTGITDKNNEEFFADGQICWLVLYCIR